VHSNITFYVYAKIGQANGGGGGRPPTPTPLDPPLVATALTEHSYWLALAFVA